MATVIRGDDNFDTAENGRVLDVTTYTSGTRQAFSASASLTMASFTVNKLSSTSTLVIQGTMSGANEYSGHMQQGWKLGSGTEFNGQTTSYQNNVNGRVVSTSVVIVGHTTTGSQTMVFRYYSANGNTTDKPFQVYNPNATDDARLAQTSSLFIVTEVEA